LHTQEIEAQLAKKLILTFRNMGAVKLSIIGGEPTLYDIENGNRGLFDIISYSKRIGYSYVRMDTNGVFQQCILDDANLMKLDELSFSIDSHDEALNDSCRGHCSLSRALPNLLYAIKRGYHVDVTMCIHRLNSGRDTDSRLMALNTINALYEYGVKRINIHPVLRVGIPRDTWTSHACLEVEEWLLIRKELEEAYECGQFPLEVRIPTRFITDQEHSSNPKYYGYCSVRMGERILIHPDGIIRCCALLIGTPYGIGRYDETSIVWDTSRTNELYGRDLDLWTPCPIQRLDDNSIVPLCISFKPGQGEYVWSKELDWDSRS